MKASLQKVILPVLVLLFSASCIYSQTDSTLPSMFNAQGIDTAGWTRGGFSSLHFSQSGYSNWAMGGENTLTLTAGLSLYYRYNTKNVYWENDLDLGYGVQHNYKDNLLEKSEDKIVLHSNYGKRAFSTFYYGAFLDFRTQFAPGYNYPDTKVPISKFMAPGYITLGPGMTWKPVPYFYLFLSPATGRLILVLDKEIADKGSYGVDSAEYNEFGIQTKEGQKVNAQFGAALVANFDKDIFENVTLQSKFMAFDNYTNPISKKRLNIDIDWTTSLMLKVNSFLGASVYTHVIYDDDVNVPLKEEIYGVEVVKGTGKRLQFKEVIGVGFSMKF